MREEIGERIHRGHQGIDKCRQRANSSVWWPGMSRDITERVTRCHHCQQWRTTAREQPLVSTPLPDRPWQVIAADLADYKGQQYMVVTDYYSRYVEIKKLGTVADSTKVIMAFKEIFARWGYPCTLRSDNGPKFVSKETKAYMKQCGIRQVTSSLHFPKSNGLVERAVGVAKAILRQEDPYLALMAYRATPHTTTGFSPARLMMGREMRDSVPILTRKLVLEWPASHVVRQKDERAKQEQKFYHDRRHGVRPLTMLHPGDQVRVKLDTMRVERTSYSRSGTRDSTVLCGSLADGRQATKPETSTENPSRGTGSVCRG